MRHLDVFVFREEFKEVFDETDENYHRGAEEPEDEDSRCDVHEGRTERVEHEFSVDRERSEWRKRSVRES